MPSIANILVEPKVHLVSRVAAGELVGMAPEARRASQVAVGELVSSVQVTGLLCHFL